MNFKEFVDLTRPVIGGKGGIQKYVRTLFEAILDEEGPDILGDYSDSSYKAYGNGNTQITNISKAMVSHLAPVEFASFIDGIGESAQLELRDRFQPYLPQINARNVGEEIADLFAAIIREAAGTKRKSTPKQGAELDDAIDAHKRLEEKILASGQSMADAWEQAVNGLLEEGSNSTHGLNVAALSQGDRDILDTFRADSKEILLYIIDNDPAAGPTEVSLSDDIAQVIQKWQLRYREIENKVLRNLVADILKTINEYTYYISDIFLRYIPGRDVLWFRNESPEEGDRLRDVLQPKSYAIRCKIAQLYQKLYPIPEDEESEDAEPIEAEIADDNAPSGTTEEDKKITVIQAQTNIVQNGENNFNLTNNGTMNFNF